MIVTGTSRTGTSLLNSLLFCTVSNKKVLLGEHSDAWNLEDSICKNPAALYEIHGLIKPVIMVRDPRSILTSQMEGKYYIAADHVHDTDHPGMMKTLEITLKYPATTHFRYEHLVRRPDQFQMAVGQYWGLEYWDEFSTWPVFPKLRMDQVTQKFGRKMNGIRNIDLGHDWREHMQRIRQQFDAFPLLHRYVIDLGYEPDTSWYDAVLEQTQPEPHVKGGRKTHIARPKGLKIGFGVVK